MRLFTPYKRRRRARDTVDGESSRKILKDNSHDGSNNDDSEGELLNDKNCWPTFVQSDDIIVQQATEADSLKSHLENGDTDSKYQKLEDASNKLLKVAQEFKKLIEELKSEESRQKRRENQNIVVSQLNSKPEIIENVGLQPASDSHTRKVKYTLT